MNQKIHLLRTLERLCERYKGYLETWNTNTNAHANQPPAIKKPPKIDQKSTQNHLKMDLLRSPGGLLGRPRDILSRLETNVRAKIAPGLLLGPLLGRSGRPLGPSWSETEAQDGSKLGPKKEILGLQKRSENGCLVGTLLRSTFSWILDRFWEGKWSQVGVKIECKIDGAIIAENLKII